MHPDIATTRVAEAHAFIAEVVEEGDSEYAERVREMNTATGLSTPAVNVHNAEALAALAAEVVETKQQVADEVVALRQQVTRLADELYETKTTKKPTTTKRSKS
jgi:hypothetical protein